MNISDWMNYMWAPGHFTNFQIKICNKCGKEMDERKRGSTLLKIKRTN